MIFLYVVTVLIDSCLNGCRLDQAVGRTIIHHPLLIKGESIQGECAPIPVYYFNNLAFANGLIDNRNQQFSETLER